MDSMPPTAYSLKNLSTKIYSNSITN